MNRRREALDHPFGGEGTARGLLGMAEVRKADYPCPACGASRVRDWGPMGTREGRIALSEPAKLYECGTCGLLFRRPYPSGDQLAEAYRGFPDSLWDNSGGRMDFELARGAILERAATGDVLDIGCYRGDFLAGLPAQYRRFGVEPVHSAAAHADAAGVEVIADTIDAIGRVERRFDVVTMFDVIEHLPQPLAALERIRGLLRPGGLLIVSTGNTDVLPWRMLRSDYWYYYAEHVSFFNPRWFRWAGGLLGIEILEVLRFSHSRYARESGGTAERWRQFGRCLAFWVTHQGTRSRPRLRRALGMVWPFSRFVSRAEAPGTSLWPDHMLLIMRVAK